MNSNESRSADGLACLGESLRATIYNDPSA